MRENKTFFCSELIAACLKVMGFLPKQICCAQYWPGTFSSDTDLKLLNGAAFEEEQQIEIGRKEEPAQEQSKNGLIFDRSSGGEKAK